MEFKSFMIFFKHLEIQRTTTYITIVEQFDDRVTRSVCESRG